MTLYRRIFVNIILYIAAFVFKNRECASNDSTASRKSPIVLNDVIGGKSLLSDDIFIAILSLLEHFLMEQLSAVAAPPTRRLCTSSGGSA
jgi:hypothetical protein